jgi:hypothetical protein
MGIACPKCGHPGEDVTDRCPVCGTGGTFFVGVPEGPEGLPTGGTQVGIGGRHPPVPYNRGNPPPMNRFRAFTLVAGVLLMVSALLGVLFVRLSLKNDDLLVELLIYLLDILGAFGALAALRATFPVLTVVGSLAMILVGILLASRIYLPMGLGITIILLAAVATVPTVAGWKDTKMRMKARMILPGENG